MIRPCPFRQPLRQPWGGHTHGCDVALNFYSVGPGLVRCHGCPVPEQASISDCEHLGIYPCLRYAWGQERVEAILYCHRGCCANGMIQLCDACPLHRPVEAQPVVLQPALAMGI